VRRKLMFVNAALLLILAVGLVEFWRQVEQANARYKIVEQFAEAKDLPSFPSPAPPQRVRPAEYMPIVERLMFYQERNPIVVVEAPPAPVVTRPDLPLLVGLMDLGDGPIALMSPDEKTASRPVAVGEKIGEYTFLGAGDQKISFEWQGETIEVSQAKLAGKPAVKRKGRTAAASATAGSRPAAATSRPSAAAPASTAAKQVTSDNSGPGGRYKFGAETRPGVYAADPSDDSPAGTEHNGFVKVVRQTPFGKQSWWQKKEK